MIRKKIKMGLLKIVLVNLLGISFFMLLDPYIYKDSFGHSLKLFVYRYEVAKWQKGEENSRLINFSQRFDKIYTNFLLKKSDNYSQPFFLAKKEKKNNLSLLDNFLFYRRHIVSCLSNIKRKIFSRKTNDGYGQFHH